jgi:hypothetical protein
VLSFNRDPKQHRSGRETRQTGNSIVAGLVGNAPTSAGDSLKVTLIDFETVSALQKAADRIAGGKQGMSCGSLDALPERQLSISSPRVVSSGNGPTGHEASEDAALAQLLRIGRAPLFILFKHQCF